VFGRRRRWEAENQLKLLHIRTVIGESSRDMHSVLGSPLYVCVCVCVLGMGAKNSVTYTLQTSFSSASPFNCHGNKDQAATFGFREVKPVRKTALNRHPRADSSGFKVSFHRSR